MLRQAQMALSYIAVWGTGWYSVEYNYTILSLINILYYKVFFATHTLTHTHTLIVTDCLYCDGFHQLYPHKTLIEKLWLSVSKILKSKFSISVNTARQTRVCWFLFFFIFQKKKTIFRFFFVCFLHSFSINLYCYS